jgi:hypothetical protein
LNLETIQNCGAQGVTTISFTIEQQQTEPGEKNHLSPSESSILQLAELKSRIWVHVLIGCQVGNWGRPLSTPQDFPAPRPCFLLTEGGQKPPLRSTNASAKYERELNSLHGDVIFAIDNC